MQKIIFVIGVLCSSFFVVGCNRPHVHEKAASHTVAIDRDLVRKIDREQVLPDIEQVLNHAVSGKLLGSSRVRYQSAFTQANKTTVLDRKRVEYLFAFKLKDCSYEIENWGTPNDCGVAWLTVVVCEECDAIISAAVFHMRM
ncbi:MAG: hypothetical protein ACKVHE_12575 [Planctomycetales bacterium]